MSDHVATDRSTPRFRLAPRLGAFALLVTIASAGGGCDGDAADQDPIATFIAALPDDDTLALDVPGEDGLAILGLPLDIIEAPLLDKPSELRVLTGTVRHYLRKLIANAADGLDHMTAGRPTLRTADGAVWRVGFPEQDLERALVMKREDGHFAFTVWVRARGRADGPGPWHFLLYGRVTPTGEGDVRGAMWLDLDNDRFPRSQGKVSVLWSVIGDERAIDVTVFDGTPDEGEVGRLTRNYSYRDGPGGGRIAFDAGEIDVHLAADHPRPERVRVFTRWNAAHAVRSDYSATGPEVHGDGYRVLIGSECWQLPDALVSYETRIAIPIASQARVTLFERGDIATCAFGVEEPPIVAAPGLAPSEPLRPDELE